jgi:hypothetical protein
MDDETPKPTIDLDSPRGDHKEREKEFLKLLPKYNKVDSGKLYYVMRKFRNRQKVLLDTHDIEDPDPFYPTYLFYCFKGKLID